MSRLFGSFIALLTALLLVPSAWGEDGASVLDRLTGLISTLDLPSGFREVRRNASPRYPDASIRYQGADGEIVMAMARVTTASSEQEFLRESIPALRKPQNGLKMLGLGDGAYSYRTRVPEYGIARALVVKGPWRLTIRIEKGARPAAEASRLAEQLIRKMYARFTGQQPARTEVPEFGPFEENKPPRITGLWHTPADPTYDDEVRVTVRFEDPEKRAVTVHWWYPDGVTRQRQQFTVPAGIGTHTFTLPKKPDRQALDFLAFVEDDAGQKVNQTLNVEVEAPFARVTAATGQVIPERRIARLAAIHTMNLYAGDVLHYGSGHRGGLGRSTTDLEWPEWNVRGRYIFDPIRHGSQSAWSKVTIGPPPPGAGLMAGVQFLFSYVVGEGISKGTKFILRGDRFAVGGAIGSFEYMSGTAGGSGMVYVKLKSLVVLQSEEDGSLGFYTYEGNPELTTPDGKTVVVPAAHRTRIRRGSGVDRPTRFDPVDVPDLPHVERSSVVPRALVNVERVNVRHDEVRADGRGLVVEAHLRIKGRKGVPTQVYAFFEDLSGVPLKDGNQRYYNQAGQVCSYVTVTPAYDDTRWSPPLELFIPYAELHLPPGRHDIQVHVEVYDPSAKQDLHVTPMKRVTIPGDGALGDARLTKLRLLHNQVRAGENGLDVLFELEVDRRVGRKTTVAAYVQFQSGERLRDYDGQYVDDQGNVATHFDVVPAHASTRWESPRIFIPYAQLHLASGVHQLRVFVRVLDPPTGTALAQSGWLDFQVAQE